MKKIIMVILLGCIIAMPAYAMKDEKKEEARNYQVAKEERLNQNKKMFEESRSKLEERSKLAEENRSKLAEEKSKLEEENRSKLEEERSKLEEENRSKLEEENRSKLEEERSKSEEENRSKLEEENRYELKSYNPDSLDNDFDLNSLNNAMENMIFASPKEEEEILEEWDLGEYELKFAREQEEIENEVNNDRSASFEKPADLGVSSGEDSSNKEISAKVEKGVGTFAEDPSAAKDKMKNEVEEKPSEVRDPEPVDPKVEVLDPAIEGI